MTHEQIEILRSHREHRVERLKAAVLRELSTTVSTLVQKEADRLARLERDAAPRKRASKR